MNNSFVLEHRIRCFNHTLQLSVKTLLRPFNAEFGKANEDGEDVDNLSEVDIDDKDDNEDEDGDEVPPDLYDTDDIDDGINELDALDHDACEEIMADMATVRDMVIKLCQLAFAIV